MRTITFYRNTDEKDSAGLSPLDQEIVRAKYGEEAQKKVRDFRTKIDSFYLTAKKLSPSRETSLAITAFQSSRQFCGIMLGELGAAYPYPTMNAPGQPVTGQRGDMGEVLEDIISMKATVPEKDIEVQLNQLRAFRDKVEDVITDFVIYLESVSVNSPKHFVAQSEALAGLLSGKMWLGERMADLSGANS